MHTQKLESLGVVAWADRARLQQSAAEDLEQCIPRRTAQLESDRRAIAR